MIFGERLAETAETTQYRLEESDYLTLESLSFEVNGSNPGAANIRIVGAYGRKSGEVQIGGQNKNLFEKWQSQLLLGTTFGQIEAALLDGVARGAVDVEAATQLSADISATHESLVVLADRVLEALQACGVVQISPTVARVTEK